MSSMKKLTQKQQRFVDEYIISGNATQSYLKAGIGLDMITAGLQVDSELRDKLFRDATEEQKR